MVPVFLGLSGGGGGVEARVGKCEYMNLSPIWRLLLLIVLIIIAVAFITIPLFCLTVSSISVIATILLSLDECRSWGLRFG